MKGLRDRKKMKKENGILYWMLGMSLPPGWLAGERCLLVLRPYEINNLLREELWISEHSC